MILWFVDHFISYLLFAYGMFTFPQMNRPCFRSFQIEATIGYVFAILGPVQHSLIDINC